MATKRVETEDAKLSVPALNSKMAFRHHLSFSDNSIGYNLRASSKLFGNSLKHSSICSHISSHMCCCGEDDSDGRLEDVTVQLVDPRIQKRPKESKTWFSCQEPRTWNLPV